MSGKTLTIQWWHHGQHVATFRNLLDAATIRDTVGNVGTWVLAWT